MSIAIGLSLFAVSFLLYALHVEASNEEHRKQPGLAFARNEWFARLAFAIAVAGIAVLLYPVFI